MALTYNLLVEGNMTAAGIPAARVNALTQRIREFFETPRPPRWSGDRATGPPDRLVYLLDHQYTQRGLAWNRLKNSDAARASALREIARRLDGEIYGGPRDRLRLGLLRAAHGRHRSNALRSLGLGPVHAYCSHELTARLNAPARGEDDWSITTPVRCSCRLCGTLTRYLRAPDKVRIEWPLAKAQRAHVHQIIDSHDLPVRHTTRRTGRPFTLVLEKTAAVFERAAAERRSWQQDLQWLTQTAEGF